VLSETKLAEGTCAVHIQSQDCPILAIAMQEGVSAERHLSLFFLLIILFYFILFFGLKFQHCSYPLRFIPQSIAI
jgi:hypothetical protein